MAQPLLAAAHGAFVTTSPGPSLSSPRGPHSRCGLCRKPPSPRQRQVTPTLRVVARACATATDHFRRRIERADMVPAIATGSLRARFGGNVFYFLSQSNLDCWRFGPTVFTVPSRPSRSNAPAGSFSKPFNRVICLSGLRDQRRFCALAHLPFEHQSDNLRLAALLRVRAALQPEVN